MRLELEISPQVQIQPSAPFRREGAGRQEWRGGAAGRDVKDDVRSELGFGDATSLEAEMELSLGLG